MEKTYLKMSELVDKEFQVKSIRDYKFVAWDNEEKKYITEDRWFKGATKKYPVETDLGTVDIGANHVGAMFESVQHEGHSNIIDAVFKVKSNGKEGKDIRYFVNPVKVAIKAPDEGVDEQPEFSYD